MFFSYYKKNFIYLQTYHTHTCIRVIFSFEIERISSFLWIIDKLLYGKEIERNFERGKFMSDLFRTYKRSCTPLQGKKIKIAWILPGMCLWVDSHQREKRLSDLQRINKK